LCCHGIVISCKNKKIKEGKTMWTDAHSHLTDNRWGTRVEEILNYSKSCGISRWVQGGISPSEWEKQKNLKSRFSAAIPGQRFLRLD